MADIDKPWDKIKPICGCHKDERIEMTINSSGAYSLFYSCPKYYPQNRKDGEKACSNRINLIEYENMVEYISSEIADAKMNGGTVDMTNHKWKKKGIEYKILNHTDDNIDVSIVNLKALR